MQHTELVAIQQAVISRLMTDPGLSFLTGGVVAAGTHRRSTRVISVSELKQKRPTTHSLTDYEFFVSVLGAVRKGLSARFLMDTIIQALHGTCLILPGYAFVSLRLTGSHTRTSALSYDSTMLELGQLGYCLTVATEPRDALPGSLPPLPATAPAALIEKVTV